MWFRGANHYTLAWPYADILEGKILCIDVPQDYTTETQGYALRLWRILLRFASSNFVRT
jgi:hypothetical protein